MSLLKFHPKNLKIQETTRKNILQKKLSVLNIKEEILSNKSSQSNLKTPFKKFILGAPTSDSNIAESGQDENDILCDFNDNDINEYIREIFNIREEGNVY